MNLSDQKNIEPTNQDNPTKTENQLMRLLRILQHKSGSSQEFLGYAINEAIEITGSKFGYIYHYHEDKKEFVLNTWSKDVMKECAVVDPQTCYELDKTGIWGEAVRQRKPIIVNDFSNENPLKKGYPDGHVHLTRFMTLPVFSDEKIVGVVGVANKQGDYTQEDLLQLQLLMDAVWKVVELRETLSREQHLKRVLLGVRNVNHLITKESDTQTLIEKACENLIETMGYFNAWIALIDKDGLVTNTASSGFDGGFKILKDELMKGKFPQCMQKVLKNNEMAVIDKPDQNCPDCPVSEEYEKRSGLCYRLTYNETVYGILAVSAPAEFVHLDEEHDLFKEVASDLGFALYKIETENKRKQAEKALLESEKKFRLIAENTADCITLMDMELNIVYVSPSIYAVRGFTPEEAIQHKLEDIFVPESLIRVQQLYTESLERLKQGSKHVESVVTLELEQYHKNGSTIWVEVSLSLIFDNSSNPTGIVSVTRDINQRKRIEAEVSEKQRMLSTLITNLPGMVYRCKFDKDWTMLFMSDGCRELTGYDAADFIHNKKLTFASIIQPQHNQRTNEKWNEAVKNKSAFEDEYEITIHDGSTRWVWERGQGVFDKEDNLLFLEGFITDITGRKELEEKLKTGDRIFQHSLDMMCIAGFDGYFKVLNPAWSTALGYSDEELLAEPWLHFVHPDDIEATRTVTSVIVDGKEVFQFENRYLCKNGSIKWLSWNSFPYPEEKIMFGVARDVTEKKKIEHELTENKNKLQSIIQVAPTGIGLLTNRIIREVNPQLCKMTGYEPEELIGKDARLLYPTQEDYDFVGTAKYNMIKNTGTGAVETRWKTKEGEIIHILLASTPLVENDLEKGVTFTATDITEIKNAEKELRFQEQRFRSLIQNSKDIISMYAGDGTILYKSPGIKHILGYDPDEVVGSNVFDMVYPDDRNKAFEMLGSLQKMNTGESARFDIRAMHKNGSLVWLDATMTNMLEEPGIRAIIGNYRNITERRRTGMIHKIQYAIAHAMVTAKNLNQLFEVVLSELKDLLDVTNFIIALYDNQTGMFTAPFEKDEKTQAPPTWPAENSLSGIIVRKKHSMLLHKKDIEELAKKGEIRLRGERAECWLGVPLLINNNPIGLIITQSYDNPNAYDQSSIEILEIIANQLSIYIEHKKAEETTQKLSKAVVQSPASIVITNPDGNIEYVNPKFTQLTGYTLQDVIGQNPRILKSGEHVEDFYKNLWDTITSGKDWSGEFRNKKKNGETYWESANISPLVNEDGIITHFVAVKEDITEKKKMIEDIIEAKEQAEAGDRLKTSFMNNISHEIRTPLNGVVGFGQLIAQSGLTYDERESYLQILKKSTDRLINTVNDYMDASLIASGALKIIPVIFNINSLLDDLYGIYSPQCEEKALQLILQIPDRSKDYEMNADRELLKKAFQHLLNNAVKFTKAGTIAFGYKPVNGMLEFYVKDTGIGIREDVMKIIFDAFNQEETGSTRNYEGSGLGLTITKGFIEKMGGKIRLDSQKGKGTNVYFTMHHQSATDNKEPKKPSDPVGIAEPEKGLAIIAEDENSNFFYLDVLLRKASFKTLRAVTGIEAVELFEKNPDVRFILMDIKMPLMDGLEATAIIKKQKPDLPIIAITAYALTGDEHRIKQAGCDDYIAKPLTRETLMNKLKAVGVNV